MNRNFTYLGALSLLAMILVFAATPALAADQTWTPATQVPNLTGRVLPYSSTVPCPAGYDCDPTHEINSDPYVHQLADGRSMAVFNRIPVGTDWQIAYMLYDDGPGWTGPYYIPVEIIGAPDDSDFTQLPNGDIVIAYSRWLNYPQQSGRLKDIYYSTIALADLEDPTQWSEPRQATPADVNTSENVEAAPSVLALSDGKMVIAYNWGSATAPCPGLCDLYSVTGTPVLGAGGEIIDWSWSQPAVVQDTLNVHDSKASLVELDNGDLLCGFYKRETGDIYSMRSHDQGASWQDLVAVYDAGTYEAIVSLLKLQNGELLAVFMTGEGGFRNIKMVRSSDNGETWGHKESLPVSYLQNDWWPSITERPDGSLLAAWVIGPPRTGQLWYARTLSPFVSITSPALMSSVSGGSVDVTVDTTADVVDVSYYLDDGATTFAVSSTPPFGIVFDSTALTDGKHTFEAVARDATGNTGTSLVSFHVDNVAPVVTNVLPAGELNKPSVTVSADYGDAGGIDTAAVTVTLDGAPLTGCTVTESGVGCPVSGLGAGAHTISGSVADRAGNVTPISGSFDVQCLEPALALGSPTPFWNSPADFVNRRLSITYALSNNGANDAWGLEVAGSVSTSGVTSLTPLPLAVGDIPRAGAGPSIVAMTLQYHVPQGVFAFRTVTYVTASDACGIEYSYPAPFA